MITYDALIRFAKTLGGQTLETSAQRKKFIVAVVKNKLVYTISNGNQRTNNITSVEQTLDRFNAIQSLKPGDYQDLTINASYLMRLLEIMISESTRSPQK